jgi:hypothetical protein
MDYEATFGKQLLQCTASPAQTIRKRLFFLILGILVIVGSIIALGAPGFLTEDDGDLRIAFGAFIAIGAFLSLFGLFFIKKAEAALYETGYVLKRGSKVTATAFNDMKGIIDTMTAFSAYGIVPVGKSRDVSVVKNDGVPFMLTKTSVPNFNQFVDELCVTYNKYLLKDLTKENIGQASISFGNKLELSGGQLIFDAGGSKGKIPIPLGSIQNVRVTEEGYWLYIEGAINEKGKAEELAAIRADKAWNLEALYRILDMHFSEN